MRNSNGGVGGLVPGELHPVVHDLQGASPDKLMKLVQEGSEPAFNELSRRCWPRLVAIGRQLLRSVEDAEEAANETLTRVYHRRLSFDQGKGELMNWISGIARNVAVSYLRRRNRWRVVHLVEGSVKLVDPGEDPVMAAEARNEEESLRILLSQLPPTLRKPVTLRIIQGKTYLEISKCLSLSLATTHRRVQQGFALLHRAVRPGREQ